MTTPFTPCSAPSPFIVPSPFDETSPGDCILRTPDGTQFKVYKAILSMASPIFSDMFTLPQEPSNAAKEASVPIVDLTENAPTIHTVLLLICPTDIPVVDDFDLAAAVVQACDKYLINLVRVRLFFRDLLHSQDILQQKPLDVYALAWRLGMEAEAVTASRYTHVAEISKAEVAEDLIRKSGSIESLLALWKLREQRARATENLLHSLPLRTWFCNGHGGLHDSTRSIFPSYLVSLRDRLHSLLRQPYPACTDIHSSLSLHSLIPLCCPGRHASEVNTPSALMALSNAIKWYPQAISG